MCTLIAKRKTADAQSQCDMNIIHKDKGALTTGGKPVSLCRVYYSVPKSTNNVQQIYTVLRKPICKRNKNYIFSILFYALMTPVLSRCICWLFHNIRAIRGRVAKFQFLKKLSRWPIFFLLQISSELKILELNIKTDSVFCLDFEQFRLKGKKCTNFTYVQITLFGDQTFRGRICKIKHAEISRTCLNKHFGVKNISIDQFVCK